MVGAMRETSSSLTWSAPMSHTRPPYFTSTVAAASSAAVCSDGVKVVRITVRGLSWSRIVSLTMRTSGTCSAPSYGRERPIRCATRRAT